MPLGHPVTVRPTWLPYGEQGTAQASGGPKRKKGSAMRPVDKQSNPPAEED